MLMQKISSLASNQTDFDKKNYSFLRKIQNFSGKSQKFPKSSKHICLSKQSMLMQNFSFLASTQTTQTDLVKFLAFFKPIS
jgi:hypothetical protein